MTDQPTLFARVKKPSQVQKIHAYLSKYGHITPLEAMRDLGIMRLAARIDNINEERTARGQPRMVSTPRQVQTRDGSFTTVAEYSYPKQAR